MLSDPNDKMTQPSSHDILNEFRAHLQRKGVCRLNFENKPFYHPESIKSWLTQTARKGEASNAGKLLWAVFAPYAQFAPVTADQIVHDHPLVLAILADMDCGHMIRAFTTSMQDSYLTITDLSGLYNSVMDSMANDQVKLPPRYRKGGYQAVIDAFDARRWAFVPASLQLKMDKSICYEKCILPFFHMDIINRGGTATVYHCKVQVDLVKDELANILESSKKKDPTYGDVSRYITLIS